MHNDSFHTFVFIVRMEWLELCIYSSKQVKSGLLNDCCGNYSGDTYYAVPKNSATQIDWKYRDRQASTWREVKGGGVSPTSDHIDEAQTLSMQSVLKADGARNPAA